ncbi:MAG: hypothetical protein EOP54_06125 [Sphingobacteriales bacterium]|nr:MAG: hypothetical protein EOP54_06125 [Sphingobacteriales bacterium]
MQLKLIYTILLLCCLSFFRSSAQYNAAVLSPGNRIQSKPELRWQRYSTSFAHFYFTTASDSLCRYALANYQPLLKRLEKESGLKSRGMNNIIIYPSLYKFFETNIGSHDPRQYSYPTISFDAGNRVLIAFKGSYEVYERDLGLALARQLWEQNISRAGLLNTPAGSGPEQEWFREGLIHYLAGGFSLPDNDSLYLLLKNSNAPGMSILIREAHMEQQLLLARGFCHFLTRHYRKDALKQVLFQLKQRKSFATAVRLVTKRNWEELMIVYAAYLKHIYGLPDTQFNGVADTLQSKVPTTAIDTLFPASAHRGAVWSQVSNNRKMIYLDQQQGHQLLGSFGAPLWLNAIKVDYPLVAVYRDKIYLLNLKNGVHTVKTYNPAGTLMRTTELPQLIQGVRDFKVSDEDTWLMAAYTQGRSDIISFNPKRYSLKSITNDLADNTGLKLLPDAAATISYRSGFPGSADSATGIKARPYGTYQMALKSKGQEALFIQSDSGDFATVLQSYKADRGSVPRHQQYWLQDYIRQQAETDSLLRVEQARKEANNPSFLSGVLAHAQGTDTLKAEKEAVYEARKARPYLLQLSNLWFNASVNNDYFINRLQPYQAQLGIYKFPEVGAMLTGGYADLFDNHEFNIGYKMPAGTEGSDFFFRYKNKKQRTDWWLMYYRKVESLTPTAGNQWFDAQGRPYPPTAKVKSFYYEAGIEHPFNYHAALSFTVVLRQSRTVFLSTDRYSLQYPPLKELWNINTLAYTYNNIRPAANNNLLLKGFKYKAMLDVLLGVERKTRFSYGITQSLDWYQPLNAWLNWHQHIAGGYSGGTEHILYNFGGMDNNVIVRIDSSAVFAQDAPYIFQQLVTPLRGFPQNTMWGNAYGLMNAELFAQVFNGMLPGKTKFSFINLLQLGAFIDLAYSRETWQRGMDWQRRNSFGLSLKTILASYPIRVDLAFPYNLGHKPMLHLSLKL